MVRFSPWFEWWEICAENRQEIPIWEGKIMEESAGRRLLKKYSCNNGGHRAQRGRGRATAWSHFWCWTGLETALYIGSAYWGARLLSQHP